MAFTGMTTRQWSAQVLWTNQI